MIIRKGTLTDTQKRKWQQRLAGVLIVVLFVTSAFLPAAPAHAEVLEWSTEDIPDTAGNVVVSGADVADFAVGPDGKTVWAVTALGNTIYKSVDAGVTWSSVTPPGGTSNITLVAIAPDDNDLVVIVADTTEMFLTTNGGTNWDSLGTPKENDGATCTAINDIAISPDDSGTHYVAAAGIEAGPLGNIWYFNVGDIAPAWKESNDLPGWASITTDRTAAIEFSPGFASDKVLVAVTEEDDGDGGADSIRFEILSLSSLKWNNQANFSNYPVVLVSDDGISGLTSASISLAPDYLGSNLFLRVTFIGLTVAGDADAVATSGIYRLKEDALKALTTGIKIHSVAYNGVKLVAGQYDDNKVHRSAGPLETTPALNTTSSLKRPGGDNKVLVTWAGEHVLAGTTGNESSLNISRDYGKSFNGISLIDTSLIVRDIAASADGSKIYLATDDGTDFSLWRKTSSWERVLAIDDKDTFIVRIAPDDSAVVYVADVGTKVMYYSDTGGDAKWLLRNVNYNIGDVAAERDNVLYIAVDSTATVSKSTDYGSTWDLTESTLLESGNIRMIKSLGTDKLIVSSTTGYVSYSTSGGDNWTSIIRQVNSSNPVQVTASGLSDGDFIYAGTSAAGQNIVRWKIGTATSWEDIIHGTLTTTVSDSPASTAMGLFGLVLQDGVLYALASDGTDSSIWRTFSPSTASSTTTWSYKLTDDTVNISFDVTPQALTATTGSTKLWALDTNNNRLYSFADTLTTVKPELSGPADNVTIKVNPVSGNTYAVAFSWLRPSKANKYDLQIGLDSNFDTRYASITVPSSGTTTASNLSYVIGPGGDTSLSFMPDTTYYWRVRVASGGPLFSHWSNVRSLTIGSLPDISRQPQVVIKQPPAPVIKVPPAPELVLQLPEILLPPAPPTATAPTQKIVIPAPSVPPAPDTPAYIWATIIIGAILLILVIILIMKPRWPV